MVKIGLQYAIDIRCHLFFIVTFYMPKLMNERISSFAVFRTSKLVAALYVGLFLSVGLHLTALLYLVFIGLALYGWQQWRTAMQALLAPAGPAMKTP